ncbi:cell wall hydrolase [Sphingomonas sp. DT-51]|uniref:cell wall hydrolase n=1 Tax=Sphingomonas sp. DT-51 TaxID=3396165 RepID=UPI003F53F96A
MPLPGATPAAPVPAPRATAPAPPPVEPLRFRPVATSTARAINAQVAPSRTVGPAAAPFAAAVTGAADDSARRALDCLAAAGFYEAGDRRDDQRAVMQVVLNRVRHPAFPKTVCGVVFQGAERRTGCQFTFTCDGAMQRRTPTSAAWARARATAAEALAGAVYAPVGLATHYHADWMLPYWSSSLARVAQVGPHIFYRWSGFWGEPAAFRARVHGDEPAPIGAVLAAPRGRPRPVLSTASDPDTFLIRAAGDAAADLARARALCGTRSPCTVMAWRDPRRVARTLPLSLTELDSLSFRYQRDGDGDGEARAQWDCARTPRRDPAECLRGGALLGGAVALARPVAAISGGG